MTRFTLAAVALALAISACADDASDLTDPPAADPPNVAAPAPIPGPTPEPAPPPAPAPTVASPTGFRVKPLDETNLIDPGPGEVLLYVSNQSFTDPAMGITVSFDGQVIIEQTFDVGDQHVWVPFLIHDLDEGDHEISAISFNGAEFSDTVTISAEAGRWAVLDYWSGEDGGRPEPAYFTFGQFDQPVGFD